MKKSNILGCKHGFDHRFAVPKRKGGFTIIEVLIVLTIASFIMAIIFLAVPALNRSARNHKRKAAVDYVATEMETYFTNNRRYPLSGTGASNDNRANFITTLQSGGLASSYDIRYVDSGASHEYPFSGAGAPASPDDALDEVSIEPGHVCNTDAGLAPGDTNYPLKSSIAGDSNYRAYAVWTLLEKNPVYCKDNALK